MNSWEANAAGDTAFSDSTPQDAPVPAAPASSYVQILRSSTLIGLSSVLSLGIGILRTKLIAMVLGPGGVGLMSVYTAIVDFTRSVAEMGVNRSGVRQIAEAVGIDDKERIACTVLALRRIAIWLGLLGMVLLVFLAKPASQLTFGNMEHATALAGLGLAVFFTLISDGQAALLQGLRRMGDLARMSVASAAAGAAVSVPVVWLMGSAGVVPALTAAAAMSALVAVFYGRRVPRSKDIVIPAQVLRAEVIQLLKTGLAFMASGMLMLGATYAVRAIVLRISGLDGAGLYTAAWTLGGLYVGLILQAMGTDFYPRLVAACNDHALCNRLVNEQAQVSILLAGPGVLMTLVGAPALLWFFYTAAFAPAVDTLRWICLGMLLKVMNWPMGFILIAKARQSYFVGSELVWACAFVGLSAFLVPVHGVGGAGLALCISYIAHTFVVYPLAWKLTGFKLSLHNTKHVLLQMVWASMIIAMNLWLPPTVAMGVGVIVVCASCFFALKTLTRLIPPERLPNRVRSFLQTANLLSSKLSFIAVSTEKGIK